MAAASKSSRVVPPRSSEYRHVLCRRGAACRRLDQHLPALRCVEVAAEDGEDASVPVLFYRSIMNTCRRHLTLGNCVGNFQIRFSDGHVSEQITQ